MLQMALIPDFMIRRSVIISFWILTFKVSSAQIGGERSFEFIIVPVSTIVSGVGGANVSLYNQSVDLFFSNPGLISDEQSGTATISYLDFISDINLATVAYTQKFNKWGIWSFGVQYMDLGNIESFDATGTALGSFTSSEYLIAIGHTRKISSFSLGANLKIAGSDIAGFNATGLMFDLGGVFVHPVHDLSIGLSIKNVGFLLKDYSDESNSQLPFDVQMGVSFKPIHMPVRFSTTIYNLYKRDIVFFTPDEQGQEDKEASMADKVFRHFVFGAEFILTPNVNLRFGYNHLRRKELRLEDTSGGAGISYGLLFKVKKFEFSYTRSGYHVAGGTNNFSLSTNFTRFIKKTDSLELKNGR